MAGKVAIIGGGPAGLMAAEFLARRGRQVIVFEAMPTVGRKFLLAGKSGLNITHSEKYDLFATRFGQAGEFLKDALDAFRPDDVRAWARELGTDTFVGSSGRVFPLVMKASPLLRAWLGRLRGLGVEIRTRHRWTGWEGDGHLLFETPEGTVAIASDATVLALGGASWPKLGSDAGWVPLLKKKGIEIVPFQPANCGFEVDWSDYFAGRFAGVPVKTVRFTSPAGSSLGEFVISHYGIEGSLVYAHAHSLRESLLSGAGTGLSIDLLPDRREEEIARNLLRQDRKASLSNRLRKGIGLEGVKAALLREMSDDLSSLSVQEIARRIKALPLRLTRPRPIEEAISSAGGVSLDELDETFMARKVPGLFLAGEMLDWEAPTGGYLLTACMATGLKAARGVDDRLARHAA